MYKAAPNFAGQSVVVNKPGAPRAIVIADTTPQEHLKILYLLGHPGVTFEEPKKK